MLYSAKFRTLLMMFDMKKLFFLFAAGLSFLQQAVSQDRRAAVSIAAPDTETDPFSTGAKAGYNLNQFAHSGVTSGMQIGSFARYIIPSFLAGRLSAQGELLYDLQGGIRQSYIRDLDGQSIDYIAYNSRSTRLHTVSVPLSLRYCINTSSVKLNLILGGGFEYVFYATEVRDITYHFKSGSSVLLSDRKSNVSDDLGKIQGSVHVGVAFDLVSEDGKVITYEMRYRKGIADINDTVTSTAALTESLHPASFSFSVYYPLF